MCVITLAALSRSCWRIGGPSCRRLVASVALGSDCQYLALGGRLPAPFGRHGDTGRSMIWIFYPLEADQGCVEDVEEDVQWGPSSVSFARASASSLSHQRTWWSSIPSNFSFNFWTSLQEASIFMLRQADYFITWLMTSSKSPLT